LHAIRKQRQSNQNGRRDDGENDRILGHRLSVVPSQASNPTHASTSSCGGPHARYSSVYPIVGNGDEFAYPPVE
jgi:hypothetical protein